MEGTAQSNFRCCVTAPLRSHSSKSSHVRGARSDVRPIGWHQSMIPTSAESSRTVSRRAAEVSSIAHSPRARRARHSCASGRGSEAAIPSVSLTRSQSWRATGGDARD